MLISFHQESNLRACYPMIKECIFELICDEKQTVLGCIFPVVVLNSAIHQVGQYCRDILVSRSRNASEALLDFLTKILLVRSIQEKIMNLIILIKAYLVKINFKRFCHILFFYLKF